MTPQSIRPAATEHAEYFGRYISLVPDGNVIDVLEAQVSDVHSLFGGVTDAQAGYAYAPGKWTLREVWGHVIDTERVFTYRALVFARGDQSALPSFDQDAWLPYGGFNARPMSDILAEWSAVRRATIALVKALPADAWPRAGTASGNHLTTRAALWIAAGHTEYHIRHVRVRYLKA